MIRVLQFARVMNRHDFIDVILQGLDRRRFQVGACLGTAQGNIADPTFGVETPHWILPWTARRQWPHVAWRLARLLRCWKCDVLHTHHYDEAVIGYLATRLCPATRLVVGRHYSDAVYRSSVGWRRPVRLAIERVVNQAAAAIVTPSTMIAELLVRRQGVDPRKVRVVPYGFFAEKYAEVDRTAAGQLRGEMGLNGRLLLGTFGRLDAGKGHRHLLDAMRTVTARFPHAVLWVVGDGAQRGALQRQIAAHGLGDAVHLLGWRRDAMTWMAAVDAVVQPTLHEAFSQVMVEALWLGKPLVMTAVSGTTDILRHGHNSLVVPPADADALAAAVCQLAGDAALGRRLAAAGQAYVREHLACDRIVPRYAEIYENIR